MSALGSFSPFVLSLSKDGFQGAVLFGTCFDKLSTNGFVAEVARG